MLAEVHCTLNVPSRPPALLPHFSSQTHTKFQVVSRLYPTEAPRCQQRRLPQRAPWKHVSTLRLASARRSVWATLTVKQFLHFRTPWSL